MWGPLAAASIYEALLCLIRMFAANGQDMKLPGRGEILAGWALPFMAEAVKEDEASAEAREMYESVRRLKSKLERNNG